MHWKRYKRLTLLGLQASIASLRPCGAAIITPKATQNADAAAVILCTNDRYTSRRGNEETSTDL